MIFHLFPERYESVKNAHPFADHSIREEQHKQNDAWQIRLQDENDKVAVVWLTLE
jgi:hypothetical protein